MKNIKTIALVFALVSLVMTSFAAGDSNESDPNIITFALGTTASGTAANSAIYRIPKHSKIDSIYVTNTDAIGANTTDYAVVTMYLDNVANGKWTCSSTTLLAVTPRAITPTTTAMDEGDTVQFKLTKVGNGTTTADLGVTLQYHNTDSH